VCTVLTARLARTNERSIDLKCHHEYDRPWLGWLGRWPRISPEAKPRFPCTLKPTPHLALSVRLDALETGDYNISSAHPLAPRRTKHHYCISQLNRIMLFSTIIATITSSSAAAASRKQQLLWRQQRRRHYYNHYQRRRTLSSYCFVVMVLLFVLLPAGAVAYSLFAASNHNDDDDGATVEVVGNQANADDTVVATETHGQHSRPPGHLVVLTAVLESCPGCLLDDLPELQSFVENSEAEYYVGIEAASTRFRRGRRPTLTVYRDGIQSEVIDLIDAVRLQTAATTTETTDHHPARDSFFRRLLEEDLGFQRRSEEEIASIKRQREQHRHEAWEQAQRAVRESHLRYRRTRKPPGRDEDGDQLLQQKEPPIEARVSIKRHPPSQQRVRWRRNDKNSGNGSSSFNNVIKADTEIDNQGEQRYDSAYYYDSDSEM